MAPYPSLFGQINLRTKKFEVVRATKQQDELISRIACFLHLNPGNVTEKRFYVIKVRFVRLLSVRNVPFAAQVVAGNVVIKRFTKSLWAYQPILFVIPHFFKKAQNVIEAVSIVSDLAPVFLQVKFL